MNKKDIEKAKELSNLLKKVGGKEEKKVQPISYYHPTPKKEKEYVFDSPDEIAKKLNANPGILETHVIKGIPTKEELVDHIKNLKGNDRLDISNIRNGEQLSRIALRETQRIDMNDMRWHGGGGSSLTVTDTDPISIPNVTNLVFTSGAIVTDGGNGIANVAITGATGLTSINGDTTPAQILVGGTNVVITNVGGTHTISASGGTGTVSSVSVTTANGVSGTVTNPTTTPAISLTLGAITPTSVSASGTIGGSNFSGSSSGTNTGDQTSVTGNAGTATKLATARTIAITGDLAYTSPSFDGSANVTAAGTLATVNANVGTFQGLTVNGKGLVTAASNQNYLTTNATTTLSGDITGSGKTAITTTLATVNSNVGSFTNPTVTVNGKGLVTAISNGSTSYITGLSVASTNGLLGTVSVSSTPVITLSTSTTGIIKGVAGAFVQAVPDTDYQNPITLTTTGGSGAATLIGDTLNIPIYSGGGGGSVTTVSVTTANGVSGTVANATTTPAISLALGAITPSSVAASGTVTGSNLSGTNTGDQTITLTGDTTGTGTGTFATTLATVNSNVGSFTNSNVTVNGKGLITAISSGPTGYLLGLSVASTNGFVGMVTTSTTPVITLSTSTTGVLKGVSGAIVQAVPDTDYQAPISLTTTGTSGAATFTSNTLNIPQYANSGGTVTSVSVATANGFAGTVATATTTPAITVKTTITGILQGNGTAISAASTNGSGNVVLTTSPILVTPALGTPSSGTLTNCTFPTLNQNTTGSAATLTTPRTIAGQSFNGSANISIASTDLSNSSSIVLLTSTQTLTNKTLTAPIISTISNTGTLTLPTSTDTLIGRATTDTLTNKRITKRVGSTTSSATPTIDTDNFDMYKLTAQSGDITSFTTNLSGTPTDGQTLIIRITDNGTPVNITWGASFSSSTIALPTTTVASTLLTIGFIYDTVSATWICSAVC